MVVIGERLRRQVVEPVSTGELPQSAEIVNFHGTQRGKKEKKQSGGDWSQKPPHGKDRREKSKKKRSNGS